jgi:HEPN domain-containing protein
MTALVEEWIEKAEGDFHSAELEISPPKGKPNYDLVCFLCQQCVEKYLKAFLTFHKVPFSKIHDLPALLDPTLPFQPLWETWRNAFEQLTEYAVEFRYPGEKADPKKARAALDITRSFRIEARRALELHN